MDDTRLNGRGRSVLGYSTLQVGGASGTLQSGEDRGRPDDCEPWLFQRVLVLLLNQCYAAAPLSCRSHPHDGSMNRYPTFRTVSAMFSYGGPSFARMRRMCTSTVRVPP